MIFRATAFVVMLLSIGFGLNTTRAASKTKKAEKVAAATAHAQQILREKLLASHPKLLLSTVHFGSVPMRKSATLSIPIDAAGCYRFVATGEKNSVEISLALFLDGREVARDRLSGNPSVEWCAESAVTITGIVTMFGGAGPFAVGLFTPNPEDASSPSSWKIGGERTDFIANRIRQLHTRFGREARAASLVLRGTLSAGETRQLTIPLPAACITVVGAGGPAVKNLDVALLDATGAPIASDNTSDGFVAFEVPTCPLPAGRYTIEVTLQQGNGEAFGIQLFGR